MAKVSIIIPLYNGKKTIKETASSILEQGGDLEVIVVDDGSTDGSADIVKEINDTRVRYLYQKNSGSPASPRNKAIKEARGEFIAFCDQDDLWYPGKLAKQLEAYDKSPVRKDIGIIITNADLLNKDGDKYGENIVPFAGFLEAKKVHNLLFQTSYITACSAVVPKNVFDEVGLLDESLVGVDEYDLWLRITKKYGVLAVDEILCAWRKGGLSSNKKRLYLEVEKVYAKHEKEENSQEIRIGHGKNLMKIFVLELMEKDYDSARKTAKRVKDYPISPKAGLTLALFDFFPGLARLVVVFLRKVHKVNV